MAELKMGSAPALLHIGPVGSTLTLAGAGDEPRVVRFALGYAAVPATLFRNDIPTALELEEAIAAVEDEVMPVVRALAGVAELVTADAELSALAAAASLDEGGELPLERVEWLFDEVTRAALGGAASQVPFELTRASAATVLILRELMHHGGIQVLRCSR